MPTHTWTLSSESGELAFHLRHLVLSSISGTFRRWGGTLRLDFAALDRAEIELTVDLSSVDTGIADRDQQIRSTEFFHVADHPTARFLGQGLEKLDDRHYLVAGTLDLHGIRRALVVEVEQTGPGTASDGDASISFVARAVLDRRDFALRWNQDLDAGGIVVGDKVTIVARGTALARPAVTDRQARRS